LAEVSRAGFYRYLQQSTPTQADLLLRARLQELAVEHRRLRGYRLLTIKLQREGHVVNHKRVLRLPHRQKGVGTRLHVFGAQSSRPAALCLRFAAIPREITGKTRGRNGFASPFPQGSLIPYNVPVYPGALCHRV